MSNFLTSHSIISEESLGDYKTSNMTLNAISISCCSYLLLLALLQPMTWSLLALYLEQTPVSLFQQPSCSPLQIPQIYQACPVCRSRSLKSLSSFELPQCLFSCLHQAPNLKALSDYAYFESNRCHSFQAANRQSFVSLTLARSAICSALGSQLHSFALIHLQECA